MKQRKHNHIVRSQFNLDFCLNTGCKRLVGEGAHVCHLQEAAGEDGWMPCLWRDFAWQPFHISHGTSSQQETTKEHVLPRAVLKSAHKQSAMLDWANGLLPASRFWEEPGGIKVTAPQALGALWLGLSETCVSGAFWLWLFEFVLWELFWAGAFWDWGVLSLGLLLWLQPAKVRLLPWP